MNVDPCTGLLDIARQVASPNCDDRPPGCIPDLLVVHGISLPPGEFGGGWIDALFTNRLDSADHPYFDQIAGLTVSAHALIRRDGQIIQYVPFHRRAWHAGQSSYAGRDRCNDFSIGIELEGTDELAYEDRQYRRLCRLFHALRSVYPRLDASRIVGHADIAPGRKTDPGQSFDWARLKREISTAQP